MEKSHIAARDVIRIDKQSALPGYREPLVLSEGSPWEGVVIEAFDFDHLTVLPVISFSNVCVCTLRRGLAHLWTEALHKVQPVMPGETVIYPAGMACGGSSSKPSAWITTYLAPSLLESVAAGSTAAGRIEIVPSQVAHDQQIESLSRALESEVRNHYPSGRLFGDSIGIALAAHLLTHYAANPLKLREYRGGIARYLLRRTIDYMQSNLDQNLRLAELASNVNLMPWHFCRMFKQSTGLSPHRYFMHQRIAAAKKRLAGPHPTIAEIARELGFNNPSHFALVFRRIAGCTPREYVARL